MGRRDDLVVEEKSDKGGEAAGCFFVLTAVQSEEAVGG